MSKKLLVPEQTLILCDEDGNATGTAARSKCHEGKGLLHQAIMLSIRDENGLVLLHKRRADLWDGSWDLGGATHTLERKGAQETLLDAAWRCLQVEWSITAPLYEKFAFTYYEDDTTVDGKVLGCEREHCTLFECTITHEDAKLQPHFAYTLAWMELSQCVESIKTAPETFTPWARIAIEHLWKAHLAAQPEEPVDAKK